MLVGLMPDRFIARHSISSQMMALPPNCTLNGHLSICRTEASRVVSMSAGWSSLVARRAHNAPNVTWLCRIQTT